MPRGCLPLLLPVPSNRRKGVPKLARLALDNYCKMRSPSVGYN